LSDTIIKDSWHIAWSPSISDFPLLINLPDSEGILEMESFFGDVKTLWELTG